MTVTSDGETCGLGYVPKFVSYASRTHIACSGPSGYGRFTVDDFTDKRNLVFMPPRSFLPPLN